MKTSRLVLLVLAMIWQGTVFGQIVINEILPGNSTTARIELKNVGSTTENISSWWVCRIAGGASYQQVSSLTAVSGNPLMMNPGDIVVLSGRSLATADELGIYTSNSFGSSTAIHDYVQWGQVNMGRSGVAQTAGLWLAADSANTIPGGYSLQYDGDGQTGVGGYSLAMPSTGIENTCAAGGPDGGMVFTTSGSSTVIGVTGTSQLSFYAENTGQADTLSYWYIITDANDNILTWVNANTMRDSAFIDISVAPAGECHVWGWSYSGLSNPVVGDHISTLNDNICEEISSNWITVIRETPDGGLVSTTSGSTRLVGVTGTNQLTFYAENTGTAPNLSYWYIITDANDSILTWVNANMMRDSALIDISGAPAGEC
ncbi:MAG: lamin tail domain-containing protein, partial [Bacteroidia bacterium]|nr:lamin tail domain-containing protein [Bacteroidia bacterium]